MNNNDRTNLKTKQKRFPRDQKLAARVTIPLEDTIEGDEEIKFAMSQIVEKYRFESDSGIEYQMSQIDTKLVSI